MTQTKTVERTEAKFSELEELDKLHFIHPSTPIRSHRDNGPTFIFTHGDRIYLNDYKKGKLIDSLSSLWNVNIGHGRKEFGEIVSEQMGKLAFASTFSNWSHEPVIRLAEKVASMTPGDLNATFFTSGGSESNDSAFKTVRHYWNLKGKPEKKKIVSRRLSYHGVAMGATSATGIKPFRDFTTSLAPDFYHVESSVEALKAFIEKEGAETIAAFISEPIQGSGGVNLPPEGYFQEVRKICDENDILFIADEVICGFGRTGKKFGIEHFGVVPDIMCVAKGISSGYAAIGGMVMSERLHQELYDLTDGNFYHGYTYSGHPVACAVALKNLEIIENENLIDNVNAMNKEFLKGFEWLKQQHETIGDYKAVGLLGKISLFKNSETKETYADPLSTKVVAKAVDKGMIGRAVIYEGQDTLAFAPPFVINKEEVEKVIEIVHDCLTEVEKEEGIR